MSTRTQPTRARHRAPQRARGWAPRALLAAATAPLGIALGMGAAVMAAVVERPALAVVGVALAGAPALVHAARATMLDREPRGRRADALADVAVHAPEPVVEQVPEPVAAGVPEQPHAVPSEQPVDVVDLRDERIDTGELQLIWDLGEGPDTAPPAVTAVPTVPTAFAARPAVTLARPRVGTAEARVYDALAQAEADELTRTLEGPARRGRHAVEGSYDVPPRTGPVSSVTHPRTAAERRGRHAA